jgi:hypothetical protein
LRQAQKPMTTSQIAEMTSHGANSLRCVMSTRILNHGHVQGTPRFSSE